MKINWKQKLTSRKMWIALAAIATSLMVIFGVDDITQGQIIGLITAISTAVIYICGESVVDAARAKSSGKSEDKTE